MWTRWGLVGAALLALILVPFALFGPALDAAVTPWLKAAPADAFALGSAALLAVDFALPVPSSVVATAAGARLGLELGALVVFGGLQLGCAGAWAVGRWIGRPAIDRLVGDPEQQRARSWLGGPGGLAALAACRVVPVLSEATTLLAGSVRLPFARFLAVTAAANAGLGLAYAGLGALSSQTGSIALAGLSAVGLPAIAIVCVSRRAPHRTGSSTGAPAGSRRAISQRADESRRSRLVAGGPTPGRCSKFQVAPDARPPQNATNDLRSQ